MTDEQRREQLAAVLATLLGEIDTDDAALKLAGRMLELQLNRHHHVTHALSAQQGAVVWGLRQRGHSWHEIRVATGITQRTGQRRMDLFIAEGIDPRPAAELDARARGEHPDD